MTRFLLALLLLVHASAAKQGQTGVVTGIVRIDTGLPVEGIRVAVIPADALIAESVLESQGLTDSAGRYRLENVSPGRYNIHNSILGLIVGLNCEARWLNPPMKNPFRVCEQPRSRRSA